MRDDFHEILTEAGRAKGKATPRTRDPEAEKEPMRAGFRNGFDFLDRLGPLRRMLRKQVGRPWNDVHAEICRWAKRGTMAGKHLLDHVRWEVRTDRLRFPRRHGQLYLDDQGVVREHRRQRAPSSPSAERDRFTTIAGGMRWFGTVHGWFCSRTGGGLVWSSSDRCWMLTGDVWRQWLGKVLCRPKDVKVAYDFRRGVDGLSKEHDVVPGPFERWDPRAAESSGNRRHRVHRHQPGLRR